MRGEPTLPAAALLPYLERAAQRREHTKGHNTPCAGLSPLADDLAERLGITAASVKRQIQRMARPGATLNRFTADAWAVALALHPALVWGAAWEQLPDEPEAGEGRHEYFRRRRARLRAARAVVEAG